LRLFWKKIAAAVTRIEIVLCPGVGENAPHRPGRIFRLSGFGLCEAESSFAASMANRFEEV
jgi:hypothetical protein